MTLFGVTVAACYQLAQSVLKIGFALAKKVDRERWAGFSKECCTPGSCAPAPALPGYRTALVSTGWTIYHLVSTNRFRNLWICSVRCQLLNGTNYRTIARQKNYCLIILHARKNTEVCGFFLVVFEPCRVIGFQERVSLKSWRNRFCCKAGVYWVLSFCIFYHRM